MEDLCCLFDKVIPVHDPEEEYETLEYSVKTPTEQLAKNFEFITNSSYRFSKYLKYTNLSSYSELACNLIKDLQQTPQSNTILIASKIKVIDNIIYDLL